MNALRIAASGMNAQQMRVDVISNNLANMSTSGYNTRRAEFSDLHYEQIARAGEISAATGTVLPTGIQLGHGVKPTAISIELAQGSLKQTNGDLDLAIEGGGYFEVSLPSGQLAYTRDGAFQRSPEGLIVDARGFALSADIVIPSEARQIAINAEGEVYAYFSDQTDAELLGQITLTSFVNPKGMEAIGNNLFLQTEATGDATTSTPGQVGLGTVTQGYLEESSVDAVREVTELIKAQRGYELNSKVISAADQMLGAAVQVR